MAVRRIERKIDDGFVFAVRVVGEEAVIQDHVSFIERVIQKDIKPGLFGYAAYMWSKYCHVFLFENTKAAILNIMILADIIVAECLKSNSFCNMSILQAESEIIHSFGTMAGSNPAGVLWGVPIDQSIALLSLSSEKNSVIIEGRFLSKYKHDIGEAMNPRCTAVMNDTKYLHIFARQVASVSIYNNEEMHKISVSSRLNSSHAPLEVLKRPSVISTTKELPPVRCIGSRRTFPCYKTQDSRLPLLGASGAIARFWMKERDSGKNAEALDGARADNELDVSRRKQLVPK